MTTLIINHDYVFDHDNTAAIPLSLAMASINTPELMDEEMIIPDGVRYIRRSRSADSMVVVIEDAPTVRSTLWASCEEYNGGAFGGYNPIEFTTHKASYSTRRIALPYMVYVHTLRSHLGFLVQANRLEIYWRPEPLTSLDDELFMPILPNVMLGSDFVSTCASYDPGSKDLHEAVHKARRSIVDTGFNNDTADPYKNAQNLKGIYPLSNWERSTLKDPKFILDPKYSGIQFGRHKNVMGDWIPGYKPITIRNRLDAIVPIGDLTQAHIIRMIRNHAT